MNDDHVAPEGACGDRIADLYTQWTHACAEEGDHAEHRCSCGEAWQAYTLDPEEG